MAKLSPGSATDLTTALQTKQNQLAALTEQCEVLEAKMGAHQGLNFEYDDPVKGFNRNQVKGVVSRLIRVKDERASTALEVAAGGKLFNVIVSDEVTATQLLERGRLRRRVTIIPLNKITSSEISPKVVQAATSKVGASHVRTALSLVGFDDELRPAMAAVFGSVLICDGEFLLPPHPLQFFPCMASTETPRVAYWKIGYSLS
jgi:structural maintenance of chromosome 2